ncbi:MAG: hypothetical protein IJ722_07250 [Alloprevotella sp.]|nr:hypothetical protein [Alloprevotella sp.]
MNEKVKVSGAPCAAEGNPIAAEAAAPAAVKKKYVPPTMQVIPLGPQRMLATSGQPISVRLFIPAMDYYFSDYCSLPTELFGSSGGFCGTPPNSYWTRAAQGLVDDYTEFHNTVEGRICETEMCGSYKSLPEILDEFAAIPAPRAEITGANWDVDDFLNNADIQCAYDSGYYYYYGTYMGQPFTCTIETNSAVIKTRTNPRC